MANALVYLMVLLVNLFAACVTGFWGSWFVAGFAAALVLYNLTKESDS